MFEGLMQPSHLLIILVIVLIIFGPGKLPELGKALGQGVRELRQSASGENANDTAPEARQMPAPTQARNSESQGEMLKPEEK